MDVEHRLFASGTSELEYGGSMGMVPVQERNAIICSFFPSVNEERDTHMHTPHIHRGI